MFKIDEYSTDDRSAAAQRALGILAVVTGLLLGGCGPLSMAGSDADADGDGVPDQADNCSVLTNPDQEDGDGDGLGDGCDACPLDASNDIDGDGVCQNVDNCPDVPNSRQADRNGDHVGDACQFRATSRTLRQARQAHRAIQPSTLAGY